MVYHMTAEDCDRSWLPLTSWGFEVCCLRVLLKQFIVTVTFIVAFVFGHYSVFIDFSQTIAVNQHNTKEKFTLARKSQSLATPNLNMTHEQSCITANPDDKYITPFVSAPQ